MNKGGFHKSMTPPPPPPPTLGDLRGLRYMVSMAITRTYIYIVPYNNIYLKSNIHKMFSNTHIKYSIK